MISRRSGSSHRATLCVIWGFSFGMCWNNIPSRSNRGFPQQYVGEIPFYSKKHLKIVLFVKHFFFFDPLLMWGALHVKKMRETFHFFEICRMPKELGQKLSRCIMWPGGRQCGLDCK